MISSSKKFGYILSYRIIFPIFICLIAIQLQAQTPTLQDCLGAIPVCQEEYVQSNVYSGYGSFNEIPSSGSCPNNCMDGEKNSVWYIVTVQSNGMMSFEIDPIVSSDDYDWGVYNLTDAECGDIYGDPSIQVACNAAGGSGYHGATGSRSSMGGTSACEGGGETNKWCADIPVLEGETYVICISNWTQSNEGYTLRFGTSTANIYDDVKPYISWVQESFGCSGETEINFEFSEFVLCSTIAASDFELLDPNGNPLTILDVIGEACESGGTQDVNYKLILDPSTPIQETGMHSLIINGPVSDLCANYANFESFDFMVVTDAPYVDFDGLPANGCITDGPKLLEANRDEGSFSILPDCGSCLEDHGDGTATLTPTLMPVGLYNITFYYDDGLCDNDTTQVILLNSLPAVFELSDGGTFCEGTQGVEIILSGTESMVWYDLKRNGTYLESRLGTGNALSFNYWDVSGTYTVEASSFCGVSSMNGSCVITEVASPTAFDISGPSYYCENSSGAVITVTNSEGGVTYELLLNGASLSPPLTILGVDASISFPPQTAEGTYTVNGSASGCERLMNGAITIEQKPSPAVEYDFDGLCQWIPTNFTNESQIPSPAVIDSYLWDFDDAGATSTDENPNYTFSNFGDYNVTLTVTSEDGCEDSHSEVVTIAEGINANAGEDQVIPYGTATTITGSATGGSSNYSYQWEPSEFVVNPNSASSLTTNLYDEYTFTFTVNDSESECYGQSTVEVTLLGGPLRADPEASLPYVCANSGITLSANAAGGSENYTYVWTSDPPGYNFDVPNPAITSMTIPTTFYVSVSDGFNSVDESIFVQVVPNPQIADVEDQVIPFDYYTQLNCTVLGGGNSFDFSWTPTDKIADDATLPNPLTVPLTEGLNFDVHIVNELGCDTAANMRVDVTGGPLYATPSAEETVLCQYDTLKLDNGAGGGGGGFTYSWSVSPGTWTSNEAKPELLVSDVGEFTYSLTVHDLQNYESGDVEVVVNALPIVNMTAQFDSIVDPAANLVAVCVFDSVYLDAKNPGFSYVWNTGSTEQIIQVGSTGIGYELQDYFVDIFSDETGCATRGEISILYSFSMCTYSIDELNGQHLDVSLFPNPVNNTLHLSIDGIMQPTTVVITDILGKKQLFNIDIPNSSSRYEYDFNFAELPQGIYLIRFISGGFSHTEKVVKNQ